LIDITNTIELVQDGRMAGIELFLRANRLSLLKQRILSS